MRDVLIHIRSKDFNADLYKAIDDDPDKRIFFANTKNSASQFIEAWRNPNGEYKMDSEPLSYGNGLMIHELPEDHRDQLTPIAVFHIRWKRRRDVNFLKVRNIDEEYLRSSGYGR